MVHYAPRQHSRHLPPPTCPKCGSHRTEIVSQSSETLTVIVRCNSCGERSPVNNELSAKILGRRPEATP
jgi:transcription elongation factor Elf1